MRRREAEAEAAKQAKAQADAEAAAAAAQAEAEAAAAAAAQAEADAAAAADQAEAKATAQAKVAVAIQSLQRQRDAARLTADMRRAALQAQAAATAPEFPGQLESLMLALMYSKLLNQGRTIQRDTCEESANDDNPLVCVSSKEVANNKRVKRCAWDTKNDVCAPAKKPKTASSKPSVKPIWKYYQDERRTSAERIDSIVMYGNASIENNKTLERTGDLKNYANQLANSNRQQYANFIVVANLIFPENVNIYRKYTWMREIINNGRQEMNDRLTYLCTDINTKENADMIKHGIREIISSLEEKYSTWTSWPLEEVEDQVGISKDVADILAA